jgi:hypothetical protein
MKKALKILGLVMMLVLFFFAGALFGSFVIDNTLWASVLWTTLPPLIFGFLTRWAAGKWWLLSGLAAIGYVLPGIGGGYAVGPTTLAERLILLILLPIVFAFLGGYIGKRLLPLIAAFLRL